MKPITAHKGSSIGEAVFRAANNGRSPITAGLEFEYNGTKYRVVEPNHAGLRSYFSYLPVDLPSVPPGLKLIYAGSLSDLLSGKRKPMRSGVDPHIMEAIKLMCPDQAREPAPEPEAEGCPCGFCNGDPDYEEVPGAEEPEEAVSSLVVDNVTNSMDRTGHRISIHLHGTPAAFGPDGAAVVKAVAEHFGVDDAPRRFAKLEAENKRLAGLYDHYRDDAQKARARAEKLEGIIHRFFIDAQEAYTDAEIIPF